MQKLFVILWFATTMASVGAFILQKDADYKCAENVLSQELESFSGRFYCHDILFDDTHPLSKIMVRKQNLTYE